MLEDHPRSRRAARVATPLVAAAALGAAAVAGIDATTSSSRTLAQTTTAQATQPIAIKASALSAAEIYRKAGPGVVDITVTAKAAASSQSLPPGFGIPGGGQSQAEGSGFVYDAKGDIVTNDHVVDGATSISVRFANGKTAKATLVGADPSTDIAVIKVDPSVTALTPLALGASSDVVPGDGVVAIGSPFGYRQSITAGIVSALGRTIQAPNGATITGALQTDAAINHGNSGGPLIDATGEVVGVNAQIAGDGSGNEGVGFAIPVDTVKSVATQLIAGDKVQHAYLGVSIGDATTGQGALIGSVQTGTPAASAGLQKGDVIVAVDGNPVTGAADLTATISGHKPGDKLTLKVDRGGSTVTVGVTLGTRPA